MSLLMNPSLIRAIKEELSETCCENASNKEFTFEEIFRDPSIIFREKKKENEKMEKEIVRYCPMDIVEKEKEVTVFIDVPGVEKDKIEINIEEDILTVSGEKTLPYCSLSKRLFKKRSYGTFKNEIKLTDIDHEKITATHKDGVLILSLPKNEPVKPEIKKISIK